MSHLPSRPASRIPVILDRLRKLWEEHQDYRLAQILLCAGEAALFSKEDAALMDHLEAYFAKSDARLGKRPMFGGKAFARAKDVLPPRGTP
jgi:uncharacterized protein YihD (DUF1040 family)